MHKASVPSSLDLLALFLFGPYSRVPFEASFFPYPMVVAYYGHSSPKQVSVFLSALIFSEGASPLAA